MLERAAEAVEIECKGVPCPIVGCHLQEIGKMVVDVADGLTVGKLLKHSLVKTHAVAVIV